MDRVLVRCQRTELGFKAEAVVDGKVIAEIRFTISGEALFADNTITVWTPTTYRFYREALTYLKQGAKAAGYKYIVTGNRIAQDLPKKEKYWKLMGYHIFTNFNYKGTPFRAAGMVL
jgi:hypothetical protein